MSLVLIDAAAERVNRDIEQQEMVMTRKPASLSQLPQEVVDLISRYLLPSPHVPLSEIDQWDIERAKPDLKNARLVNRAFSNAAESLLFASIGCNMQAHSMQKVVDLSSSQLASRIRSLRFDSRCEFYKRQSLDLLGHLYVGLAKFVNLRSISLRNGKFRLPFPQIWASIVAKIKCEKLVRLDLESLDVCHALAQRLSSLQREGTSDHNSCHALTMIRELSLHGRNVEPLSDFTGSVQYGDWTVWASIFPNLRNLHVHLLRTQGYVAIQHNLPHIRNLVELRLVAPQISSDELISMIQCTKGTLERLEVTDCSFRLGTWQEVFAFLRTECPNLFQISFANDSGFGTEDVPMVVLRLPAGQALEVNWFVENEVNALKELAEQIDKNRKAAGLKPAYHPLTE